MPASPRNRTPRSALPRWPPSAFASISPPISPSKPTPDAAFGAVIVAKRPDIERFLAKPAAEVRAVLIYGRDRSLVHERADQLAKASTARPDDPFDVALLTDGDIDAD